MTTPEPRWLSRLEVEAQHAGQLIRHGGDRGLRDVNLLESALARPRQRWTYEGDADLPTLAAAYCFGLAKNHAFVDGNKRVAFMAMYTFLGLNGLELEAPEPEVVGVVLSVITDEMSEAELADWVRQHVVPFPA